MPKGSLVIVFAITLTSGIFIGGNLQTIDRRVATALVGMPMTSTTTNAAATIATTTTDASTTVTDFATSSSNQAALASTTTALASTTPNAATSTASMPKKEKDATSTPITGNAQIPPQASSSVRTVSLSGPWIAYPTISVTQ